MRRALLVAFLLLAGCGGPVATNPQPTASPAAQELTDPKQLAIRTRFAANARTTDVTGLMVTIENPTAGNVHEIKLEVGGSYASRFRLRKAEPEALAASMAGDPAVFRFAGPRAGQVVSYLLTLEPTTAGEAAGEVVVILIDSRGREQLVSIEDVKTLVAAG
jgi:hypothetical protein